MNTQSSTSISTSFFCKHHLPCGWCELKKEQCTQLSYTMPKEWFEPKWNEPVTVYGCPARDGGPRWEVTSNPYDGWINATCAADRSGDDTKTE